MSNSSTLTNLLFNENAYFYKNKQKSYFSIKNIEKIFAKASNKKKGNFLVNVRKKKYEIGKNVVHCSVCVFKYENDPTFIKQPINNWKEVKFAFMLIADFKDYTFIIRRNISSVSTLLSNFLEEVEYSMLSTLFVNDETSFEKIAMRNTNISQEAVKGKILEATNLKESMPTIGHSGYVPNSMRVRNLHEKTSVFFNTARISNYKTKIGIVELLEWGNEVVEKIKNFSPSATFLDVFASPVNWESCKDILKPSSILFNTITLHDEIESGAIQKIYNLEEDGSAIEIDSKVLLECLQEFFSIQKRQENQNDQYYVQDVLDGEIILVLNPKSISLKWGSGKEIYLRPEEGEAEELTRYINRNNDYIIYFEQVDYVYTMRSLFQDKKLLGYVDSFLNAFHPCDDLEKIKSEKGEAKLNDDSEKFPEDCLFGFIEDKLMQSADYGILDDLGDEWADYILLGQEGIQFVHAKHGVSAASASAFHDVVSQALKNIGNFTASKDRLEKKRDGIWSRKFILKNTNTNIRRFRKGDNIKEAVSYFVDLTMSPMLKREVVLVVNFISKRDLTTWVGLMKKGDSFAQKKQVIQILWLISSLINTCMENGIGIKIYCKR